VASILPYNRHHSGKQETTIATFGFCKVRAIEPSLTKSKVKQRKVTIPMADKHPATESHKKAVEHHTKAAEKHEEGQNEEAEQHAHTATGHRAHAEDHAKDATKKTVEHKEKAAKK